MTMIKRRILVDIDSTLYPSEQVFIKYLERLHGVTLTSEQMADWDRWWRPFMTKRQFTDFIQRHFHSDDEIRNAVPYRGATTALRAWKKAGHIIHIVSDRHPKTQVATAEWLEKIGAPYDRLVLEWRIDKIEYAVGANLNLIIDDKPATLRNALAAGLWTATLAHPHNRETLRDNPEIVRARSWPTLRRKIEKAYMDGTPFRRRLKPMELPAEGDEVTSNAA